MSAYAVEKEVFKLYKCIICQKLIPNLSETSTLNGRNKIREAANIRRDEVYYRLNLISQDGKFHKKLTYVL